MIEPKLMVWLSHKRKEGSNKRAMMLLSSRAEKTDKNSRIVEPSLLAVFPASETNAKTATITIIHAAASAPPLPVPSAGIHLPRIVASPSSGTA